MGSWGEPYCIPLCPLPHPTQKMLPHPNHHHLQATPSGARGSCTWSFHSCGQGNWPGTRSPLLSCITSFGGGYPSPHDTPSPTAGGIKRVYKCQVEGCSEGPSTSHATICVHVHRDHLGVRLACPSCTKTFLNSDALRCHKKSKWLVILTVKCFSHSNCHWDCYYFFFWNQCWKSLHVSSLCVRPVEVPGSLSLCVVYVKGHSCVCLCIRPVEVPGSLSSMFSTEFVNSEALRKKLTCYLLVKGKAMCLKDHLLINSPMVLIPLSPIGLMLLLLLVMSANQFSGWGCHALPGSLWGCYAGIYLILGQLHSGQIVIGPLPHHPKIQHRDYIERIPLNAKTE